MVKIETHYLGGMRHFYRWEIADIGVLVFLRPGNGASKRKVALLQSKRLYPETGAVRDETQTDYAIGFGRLADRGDEFLSIGLEREYWFTDKSRYDQLRRGSEQVRRIEDYQSENELKVYYQLYNPWSVPFVQRIPLAGYVPFEGSPDVGVRIIPAVVLHPIVSSVESASPALADVGEVSPLPPFGWRLETFICDELLACREGDLFTSNEDPRIGRLFNRRSGPVSAAIAITIEAPAAVTQ